MFRHGPSRPDFHHPSVLVGGSTGARWPKGPNPGRSADAAERVLNSAFEVNDLLILTGVGPSISSPDYVDAVLAADKDEVLPLLARASGVP